MKKIGIIPIAMVIVLVLLSFSHFAVASSPQKQIVLKTVLPFGRDWTSNDMFLRWVNLVDTLSGGKVKIKVIGGTEVIPTFGLPAALKKGSIDLFYWPMGYAETITPAARVAQVMYVPPRENRKAGVHALIDKALRDAQGMTTLGQVQAGGFFCYFARKPVRSLAGLKGLKMRSGAPLTGPPEKALGIRTVSIPAVEAADALNRGVIDGLSFSSYIGYEQGGFPEVVPYRVGPGFCDTSCWIFMMANKYDALPADVKELLVDITKQVEFTTWLYYRHYNTETERRLVKAGKHHVVKWSDADNKAFMDVLWRENIKWVQAKVPAKYSSRILEIWKKYRDKMPEIMPYQN